jgi:hypothetical protein
MRPELSTPPELAGGTCEKTTDAERVHPVDIKKMRDTKHEGKAFGKRIAASVIFMGYSLFKNPALERDDNSVSSITGVEFGQDTLHVSLHGVHGKLQVIRDDLVGLAQRDQLKNI